MKNAARAFLRIDFKHAQQKPLIFSNPIDVITTSNLREVVDCMKKIDQATKLGYYTAGYLSYEATYALRDKSYTRLANKMPLLWFGVFDEPTVQEIVGQTMPFHLEKWEMSVSKKAYERKFNQIKSAISAGVVEQINYTVPFHAKFSGDTYHYYHQLKQAQSAQYSAYLSIGDYDILSASPELFFSIQSGNITVRPMKGTIHRGKTYEEDIHLMKWLAQSEKNKLENHLTVQFMKNEIAKVVQNGDVQVFDKYRVEKYPTVYQMTSGLTGKVAQGLSAMDVMAALFPCGSIAGVPKETGLDLIHQLETLPREVYCGAIGYITPEKEAVFNVPIRTVWVDRTVGIAHYGAGGAITKHSKMAEEFQEILTKTGILTRKNPSFDLLETLGLYDGKYVVLEEHLHRLKNSAAYFDIPIHMNRIRDKLEKVILTHPAGNWRVRLLVNREGEKLECYPLIETGQKTIRLADSPIDKDNPYLYHKTTHRSFYETFKNKNEDVFDVLLWNEYGEITECTTGNIVAEIKGRLYTPPVTCGLLPGTFRAHLLHTGKIREKVINKDKLGDVSAIWLINSVRKWVSVHLAP